MLSVIIVGFAAGVVYAEYDHLTVAGMSAGERLIVKILGGVSGITIAAALYVIIRTAVHG